MTETSVEERVRPGRYDAFVSYSRAVDGRLAPALQQALQRFAKPWYRVRALRIFRDDASLSSNPGLWSSIQRALDASEFFILLASPEAARSRWVAKEAEYWRDHKPHDRLLIALTDGELAWAEGRGDFDWERSALPAVLAGVFREEPRYTDLRWARTEEHLSLSDARFRESVADLAAPLHGRAKDELFGEEVRQHRRTVRLARAAAAVVTTLAVAATAAAVLAVQQRNTARTERDRAEEQARVATSRSLADAALQTFDEQLDLGLLLALEAFRLAPTAEARDAVVTAVQRSGPIERTLPDDPDGVTGLVLRPGGSTVVTESVNGRVTLWDAATGRRLRRLRTGEEGAASVAARGDGLIAVGGEFAAVTLWDGETGRRVARLPDAHDSEVVGVAFSADGARLASVDGEGTIALWDVARRRQLRTLDAGVDELFQDSFSGLGGARFSPDGRTLVFGGPDGWIRTWRLDQARPQRRRIGRHGDVVQSLAFAPAGGMLVTAADNGSIRFWDYVRGRALGPELRAHPGGASTVGFDRDGGTVVSGGADGVVRVWDVAARRAVLELRGHAQPVTSAAFGPAASTLVSGSDDGTVKVWNVGRAHALVDAISIGGDVDRVAASPDGRTLAVGGLSSVRFWDLRARRPLSDWRDVHGGEFVTDVDFDGSGRIAASTGVDGSTQLWDARSHRPLGPLLPPAEEPDGYEHTTPLALRPDGSLLATAASESVVTFWDVRTRTRSGRPLEDPLGSSLASVAFSPDGRLLALGAQDGSITLWDVDSRRRVGPELRARGLEGFTFVQTLAFSPDGRLLATGGDDDLVRFWDVRRRRALGEPLRGHGDAVASVAFTPDGSTLASGGEDGTVRLWDVARRRPIGEPLVSGAHAVKSVAFAAEGGRLVAATGGPRVLVWKRALWPVRPGDVAARLCAAAGRNLTRSEWAEFVAVVPYEQICPAGGAG